MLNDRGSAAVGFVPIIVIALAFGSYLAVSSPSNNFIPPTNTNNGRGTSSTCTVSTSADDLPNDSLHGYLALNSSIQLCVDYYYFNSSSVISFNPQSELSLLTFYSVSDSNATYIVTANTFSISATSQSLTNGQQIEIGGPSAVNEGTEVTYTISPTNSTQSGIYFISLKALVYPTLMDCESVLELVVGNQQYIPGGLFCIHVLTGPSPAYTNGFIEGHLFAQVVGMTNSTTSPI